MFSCNVYIQKIFYNKGLVMQVLTESHIVVENKYNIPFAQLH